MTLAERYNAEANRLLPHMADRLTSTPPSSAKPRSTRSSFAAANIWAAWLARSSPSLSSKITQTENERLRPFCLMPCHARGFRR